jgi:hypothetical protein
MCQTVTHCDKYLNTLKKKRFTLAFALLLWTWGETEQHSNKSVTLWWSKVAPFMVAKSRDGDKDKTLFRHAPSDLLTKFPPSPNLAPPAGDQAFNTWTWGGHFFFLAVLGFARQVLYPLSHSASPGGHFHVQTITAQVSVCRVYIDNARKLNRAKDLRFLVTSVTAHQFTFSAAS